MSDDRINKDFSYESIINSIIDADDDRFSELANITNLNPKNDFIGLDLRDAILNGVIVKKKQKMIFEVYFEYPQMNDIMQLVKNNPLTQLDQQFELHCKLKLSCPNGKFSQLKAVFLGIENVKIVELEVE